MDSEQLQKKDSFVTQKLKSIMSSNFSINSMRSTCIDRTKSTASNIDALYEKYKDILREASDDYLNDATTEHPFDALLDEDDFLFGKSLNSNINIAYEEQNYIKVIQMAQEPWPDNVKLYQPYEVEQILLPDNASSLAVQAFLKMCDLPFEIEMRWNAEFMSPSGRIPFIKCGPFVVSELEPIVQFCTNKGISLTSKLTNEQCAEMRAYMSLITNVLVNAELYISWLDKETYNEVTKPRNSSVYPWPLGWLQTRSKKSSVAKRLNALDWYNKTLDQVLSDVEHCCNSLSQQLGDRDFFFGTPNELDALIYGHIRALLSTDSTKSFLFMKPITTVLLMHTLRVANHTKMDMKPREMFLINQALESIHRPRAHSLAHSNYEMSMKRLSTHSSRLKHKPKSTRSDSGNFGFKPFATKEFMEQAHIETIQTAIERAINESQHHSDDSIKTLVEEKDDSIVNDEIEEEAVCVHKGKMNDCSSIGISDSVKNESLSDVVKISDLEMNEINDVSINYVSIDDFFNDHLVEKHFDPVGGDSF